MYVLHGGGSIKTDTETFQVKAGDFAVINANCMHGIYTQEELFIYHCLIVDRSFCLANHFDTNHILFTPVFQDAEMERLMKLLEAEYSPPLRPAYRVQMIRAYVLQIMAWLCCEHSTDAENVREDSHLLSCIKQAIGYIRARSEQDISLDEVADFVGLSKYYFAREFRRVTGETFVTYINLIRCERAKQLLSENSMQIGEVGRACGFRNQSYFTKTFQSYTGYLPGIYREKHRDKHQQ